VRRNRGRAWRAARGVQDVAPAIGDEDQACVQLGLVRTRRVLHGRRVVGFDGGLELRQIGDEACHQRERLRALGPELIDLRRRGDDLALDRALGLRGDALIHEVDREADARHREQRAREEDAALERRENLHRTVKSSSATPPSVTPAGFGSEAVPSFHAMTLYVPGGTFSIR
jgi:hypothetical protein